MDLSSAAPRAFAAVLAFSAAIYLIWDFVADQLTNDSAFLIPAYGATWGIFVGTWPAVLLPLTVVPAGALLAIVGGYEFAWVADDEPGALAWAVVLTVFSMIGVAFGLGARRLGDALLRSR